MQRAGKGLLNDFVAGVALWELHYIGLRIREEILRFRI